MTLHRNSQGLNRLDRFLGSLLAKPGNLTSKAFGMAFATYIEWCRSQYTTPKGRVFLALVSLRFRLDRSRGDAINQIHLLSIPLQSYKMADIRAFVDRVRWTLVRIGSDEAKSHELWYTWLWEKFKGWHAIASKVERIRESPANSPLRSWNHLWGVICNHLDNAFEDENQESMARGIQGQLLRVSGTPATTGDRKEKKEKKDKKDKDKDKDKDTRDKHKDRKGKRPSASNSAAEVPAAPATGGKTGKKGKGARGAKGEGKGKSDALQAALAKHPKDRTPAECKMIPCKFHCLGTCERGNECAYSHDPEKIKAAKARFEAAKQKTTGAPATAGGPSESSPAPKKPSKKTTAAAAAGVAAASASTADGRDVTEPPPQPQSARGMIDRVTEVCAKACRPTRQYISKSSFTQSLLNLGKKVVAATTVPLLHGTCRQPAGLMSAPFVAPGPSTGGIMNLRAAPAAVSHPKHDDQEYDVEYILDTGAGRTISSQKEFERQGVPRSVCKSASGPASAQITFTTGGGEKVCNTSLGLQGAALGGEECYLLEDSPFAVSMGSHVSKGIRLYGILRNRPHFM